MLINITKCLYCFDLTLLRKQEQTYEVKGTLLVNKSVFIRQIWKDHILYCSILSMTYMIEIIFKKIKSCTFVPKYINFKNYKIKSWIGTTKDWDPVTKINPTRNHQWTEVKTKEESKKETISVSNISTKKNYEKSTIWKSIWPNNKTWKSWTKLAWEDFEAMMDSNYSL